MRSKIRPSGSPTPLFSFVVVADTHVNESDNVSSSPFETNHLANERARFVFQDIAAMDPPPAFVVHLGDIVHPMPALPTFMQAVEQFKAISAPLTAPLHVLPGNHDVGDKKIDWMPADQVCDAHLQAYRNAFGKDYYSFDTKNIRCCLINSLLINSGLSAEQEQKTWLEEQIATAAGKRVFLFMHYPPFVYSEAERGSYDNLDEPGRSWLLGLMKNKNVEASFAGHVHNFWYEQLDHADFYMLPSTAFLRHDYSEFYRVKPTVEFGRGDVAKFGYFIVDVFEKGHIAYPVRTMGGRSALENHVLRDKTQRLTHPSTSTFTHVGVELRHTWTEVAQIPATGGVQEFGRKLARNDYPLLALWEMGARLSKVTDQDVLDPSTHRRMHLLSKMGHRFMLTSLGAPKRDLQTPALQQAGVSSIEINVTLAGFEKHRERIKAFKKDSALEVFLCKLHMYDESHYDGQQFSHFVKSGFTLEDLQYQSELIQQAAKRNEIDGITVRVEADQDLLEVAPVLMHFAEHNKCQVLASLKLNGPSIAESNDDELGLLHKICCALLFSKSSTRVQYIFDTFMDVDRGYYPRQAFIDRQFNPRLAASVFGQLNSILSGYKQISIDLNQSHSRAQITFSADGIPHKLVFSEQSATGQSDAYSGALSLHTDLCAEYHADIEHAPKASHTNLDSKTAAPAISLRLYATNKVAP